MSGKKEPEPLPFPDTFTPLSRIFLLRRLEDFHSGNIFTGIIFRKIRKGDQIDKMTEPLYHVTLVAPEIPQNTGNIGRICCCTECRLHLVEPISFSLEDKYVRRAGMDYWRHVDFMRHASWEEFERFPTSWKKAKTVVVPKDGDPHEPRNWRPITITSTAYRVVMCLISRAMQSLNSAKKFINDQQHGFTKTPNGAMMHIGVINELIKHADRTRTAVYMMSIDLRDAFGSVSHDLIRYALRAKGFGEGLIKMIMDAYKNATTRYVVNGGTSDPLFINRGV